MSSPAASTAPLTGARLWVTALVLALANFTVVLDLSIANVSVPHIAGALAVSPTQGTWVITSYAVAEAITVPLTGWLAQRFGPVRVFIFAMAGFGLFSMACGLAPTFGMLVACRVAQGLCGGPLMPTSQTLLLQIFPQQRSSQALGIWSSTVMLGPVMGPILGGAITDNIHWSWIFLINVPVAAMVAFGAWRLLRGRPTITRLVPVDYVGLGLLVLWVGSLQIMLDRGKELDWFASGTIVCLAVIALVGFLAFLIWELTAENPIVNLRIFRHRGFVVGVTTLSLGFGAYFASVVLVPLWLQTTMGYTASWAGTTVALSRIIAVFLSPVVARQVGKIDHRLLISVGVGGMACVFLWRSHFTTDANFWAIALPQMALGACIPFMFIPTTGLALSSVLPEEVASAAGLSNFLRTTAGAFGTSIMTTAWENSSSSKRYDLAAELNDVPGALATLMARGASHEQAVAQVDRLMQNQAVMLATDRMFMFMAVVFMVAASAVWLAPKPKVSAAPGGGH